MANICKDFCGCGLVHILGAIDFADNGRCERFVGAGQLLTSLNCLQLYNLLGVPDFTPAGAEEGSKAVQRIGGQLSKLCNTITKCCVFTVYQDCLFEAEQDVIDLSLSG